MTAMDEGLQTRIDLYKFLASVLLEAPTREHLGALAAERLLDDLEAEFGAEVAEPFRKVVARGENALESVKREYMRLLRVPVRGDYVTPYEAVYRDDRIVNGKTRRLLCGPSTIRVKKFYQAAGVTVDYAHAREIEDHISHELSFLVHLQEHEQQAASRGDDELVEGYREAAAKFLDEHLLRWLPALCERLEQNARGPFYQGVARLCLALAHSHRGALVVMGYEQAPRSEERRLPVVT